jgi:uncharacterized protein with GYD domain
MPTYIVLFKLTDQGIKEIKDTPNNIKEAVKGIEAAGGRLKGLYAVMGEYDFVGISEFPSDEVQMTNILSLVSRGGVRATTLKAFSVEDFTKIVEKLP